MSTKVQLRRGNTAQTAVFTGAVAEITVDTDKNVVVVHDGITAGGHPLTLDTKSQSAFDKAQASFDTANSIVELFGGANNSVLTTVSSEPSTLNGISGDKRGYVYLANDHFYFCFTDYTTGSTAIWTKVDIAEIYSSFVSKSTLKTIVASSTDFADFKTRIAAL